MIQLITTSGIVQYAESAAALLDAYNADAQQYELRRTPEGVTELWHKGHRRLIGVIPSLRTPHEP